MIKAWRVVESQVLDLQRKELFMQPRGLLIVASILSFSASAAAKDLVITGRLHHLRQGEQREWSDFPAKAEGSSLQVQFQAQANTAEQTLRLRQQDVKQTWKVLLNGKELARLRPDENDMVIYLPVPPGGLMAGNNTLRIEQVGKTPDDIRVGEIVLDDRPVRQALSEAAVEVQVTEADRPVPCRLTVLNAQGALMTVGAQSNDELAVRPGIVYTGTGRATFGLPVGKYTIYAGRGFAYGIDSTTLTLKAGDTARPRLSIRREVPTPGYVSCDTHVHTLSYSGHGDATLAERMLTVAGEGIEFPIATDHNAHVDYLAAAVKHKVRPYFTPVIGNEVTTPVGHFNIFPVPAGAPIPEFESKDWKTIFDSIARRTEAKVIILNHPRDLHSGYRPFGPRHHNAATGENLDGWVLRANAMEVINSGALQTDPLLLYRDWFAMLNRGIRLTPVGASDSHDVGRYIIGQGRTYIRARADDPSKLDIQEAVSHFRAGRVLVSLGLLADITVNDKYGPGDLVPASGPVKVRVRVLGPSWTTAEKVELFANGRKIREARIADGKQAGVKWSGEWILPRFPHDVHLAAIATGPGVRELYWPIGKPYQPTSPVVDSRVIGSTGAVWIDSDGDGQWTSAYEYAQRLMTRHGKDVPNWIQALAEYDEAVAVQAATRMQAQGIALQTPEVATAIRKAGPHVERGFQQYFEAWRECQIARSQQP